MCVPGTGLPTGWGFPYTGKRTSESRARPRVELRSALPDGRADVVRLEGTGAWVRVLGGSAGIGLETARRARAAGADVILTGRDPGRLGRAALEVDARSSAAFDPNDRAALKRFFDGLPGPIDHVLVTAGGPHVSEALALELARNAAGKIRPGGTLLLMDATAVSPPFTAALATALAMVRVRVNLIAPGFVDIAALALDVMANTTVTGATYDIDGGEQLLARGV